MHKITKSALTQAATMRVIYTPPPPKAQTLRRRFMQRINAKLRLRQDAGYHIQQWTPATKKWVTIYTYPFGITELNVRKAFEQFVNFANLSKGVPGEQTNNDSQGVDQGASRDDLVQREDNAGDEHPAGDIGRD
jgi:hypothetical protein